MIHCSLGRVIWIGVNLRDCEELVELLQQCVDEVRQGLHGGGRVVQSDYVSRLDLAREFRQVCRARRSFRLQTPKHDLDAVGTHVSDYRFAAHPVVGPEKGRLLGCEEIVVIKMIEVIEVIEVILW